MKQSLAIREQIRSSKDRCQTQHHLSPGTNQPVLRLQQAEVAERRERFLDIIGGFGPELDKAAILPDKGRYCLLISDTDGIVVESYLPDGYAVDFSHFGIALGGVWNEHVAGTNGIDMALRSDRLLTVQGPEHFYRCFQSFACSSSPLHDAQNNLVGCVTLVGSAQRQAAEIAWCELVLRVTGSRLQATLFRRFHSDMITARLVSHSGDRASRFETMVACDENGTIRSSLALWRDGTPPPEHKDLEGRHLSDLRGLTVNAQGPALVLPRRMVSVADWRPPATPLRPRAGVALARMAAQGGGMDVIVDRARKLASHRVPLLICGENGCEKEAFARALLDEILPNAPLLNNLDCARLGNIQELAEALHRVRFLSEYPIDRLSPVLVLLNVDRLAADLRVGLQDFLEDMERKTQGTGQPALCPILLFTVQRCWRDLQSESALDPSLLYLLGQSVVDLPPVRDRDVGRVLDSVLEADFSNEIDLSEAARSLLLRYDWPGNLREMRAALREAAVCGNGRRINLVDLPSRLANEGSMLVGDGLRQTLLEALDSTDWNVTKAAAVLGKSRATINRWIVTEGLHRPE